MAIVIFGGGWLVKALLEHNDQVIVCDIENSRVHDKARSIPCDIRNPDDFKQIPLSSKDVVINLAANQYHYRVPRKNIHEYFFVTNARGTKNILDFIVSSGGRKIHSVYNQYDIHRPQIPFGPYGHSKKAWRIYAANTEKSWVLRYFSRA
jgi:dTDP-glucose 4,6-dehydratase